MLVALGYGQRIGQLAAIELLLIHNVRRLRRADQHIADAVGAVLSDWNIPECTELEGDIFRISFEGVFFPLDDVLDALRPLLCAESSGKIDLIDMEAWTLTRAAFSGTEITVKTVGLNHVLAYSGH